jgi:predicted transcriptional regulator
MSISLSPEVQRRIERTLSESRYESANALVLEALDALESLDGDSSEQAGRFDAEISEALREIERGEYTDYSQEQLSRVFERARTQGLEFLAETQPRRITGQDLK